MAKQISNAQKTAIIRRLLDDQAETTIAKALRVSAAVVRDVKSEHDDAIAKAKPTHQIRNDSLHPTEERLLLKITGGLSYPDLSKKFSLPPYTIGEFFRTPETFSVRRIKTQLIEKLHMFYPDKAEDIATFEVLTCILKSPPVSRLRQSPVRKKQEQAKFREAASMLLLHLHETSGKSLDEIRQQIPDRVDKKIVRDNVSRIVENDPKLATTAMRAGIQELIAVYDRLHPQKPLPYKHVLQALAQRLGG